MTLVSSLPSVNLYFTWEKEPMRLTVTLEFHFVRGKGSRWEIYHLCNCCTATLREYLKHSCFLSNFRNCILGTTTHKVFSETPFSTYHLSCISKTSNFLFLPLFGPCIPSTRVWIDSGLPLGNSFCAFLWAKSTIFMSCSSHSPHLLYFLLCFFSSVRSHNMMA